nr:coiled-coil domain-containing protein 90B, mitochondrial-like [Gorilla gorilla gorilla]
MVLVIGPQANSMDIVWVSILDQVDVKIVLFTPNCREVASTAQSPIESVMAGSGTQAYLSLRRDFFSTTTKEGYDRPPVDITPLEERKLTFDTHVLVQDLETHGFDKTQAETIVSALTTLSNVSPDTTYKKTVTQAQQKITVQQLMAHLDSIRKNMVILEKSEFANLRAENEKMKIESDQVKQQLIHESS